MGRRLVTWIGVLAALLTLGAEVAQGDQADALRVVNASLRQSGDELVLRVRTPRPVSGRRDLGGSWNHGLCLSLSERSRRSTLCFRPGRGRSIVLRDVRHRAGRQPVASRRRIGPVRRSGSLLSARFALSAAHVTPGDLSWSTTSWWTDASCPQGRCSQVLPTQNLHVRRTRPAGCSNHGRWFHRRGGRRRRQVALTFDDGPGPHTRGILRALRRAHAHATFFVLGNQIRGRARLLRRELSLGNEVADHSWSHPALPSYTQIRSTAVRIRRATGFRPCLFRPPYGTVNSRLVSDARRLGMRTIDWDVDPRDWSRPGAGALANRVVNRVHPGAIVVMHDGGAGRGQTVAALPIILRRLRRRGYRAVTVTQLLGGRKIWRNG